MSDEDSGSSSFIGVDKARAIASSFAQASGELSSGTRLKALFWLGTSALELEEELELELEDGTRLLALDDEELEIDMLVSLPCTSIFGLLYGFSYSMNFNKNLKFSQKPILRWFIALIDIYQGRTPLRVDEIHCPEVDKQQLVIATFASARDLRQDR